MPNDRDTATQAKDGELRAATVRAAMCPLLLACSEVVRSSRVAKCVDSFRVGAEDGAPCAQDIVRDTLDDRCSLREGFAAVATMEARRAVAAAAASDEASVMRYARLAASAAIDAAELTENAAQVRAVADAVLASLAPT